MIFGRYINKYYLKYLGFYLVGIASLFFVDYISLMIPSYYRTIIDGIKDSNIALSYILEICLNIIIIGLLIVLGRILWRLMIMSSAARVEANLRDDLYRHSQTLPHSFYKKRKTGALMALYTNDLQTIRISFGWGVLMFFDAIILGILSFMKMWNLSPMIACICLVPLFLSGLLAIIVGKRMSYKSELRQKSFENLSDFTQENFSGISVIKAFVKEIKEITTFQRRAADNSEKNLLFVKHSTLIKVIIDAIIGMIFISIIGIGSYMAINNPAKFTIGMIQEFIAYFSALIWPMIAISELLNINSQGRASYRRIKEIMDVKNEYLDGELKPEIKGEISFSNLDFKFEDDNKPILKNITFKIEANTSCGITGKIGCGKSILVDLLLHIYEANNEEIKIDQIPLNEIDIHHLRENISYVPQDSFLFSDTIENNICFAFKENEVSREKIEKCAKICCFHEEVLKFENGYKTIIGERGTTLSGGQKQRLTLARALLKDAPILIIDDALSAVDVKTEGEILQNILAMRQKRTTIIIAHRISTISKTDKIIIMDEGMIVGEGTHQSLIENNELYREMVLLQQLTGHISGGEDN